MNKLLENINLNDELIHLSYSLIKDQTINICYYSNFNFLRFRKILSGNRKHSVVSSVTEKNNSFYDEKKYYFIKPLK